MAKSEVYTWRVATDVKARLEEAARRERRSIASLLEAIVIDHFLAQNRRAVADAGHQRELHAHVARLAGSFAGSDPDRSANVRVQVRAQLKARRDRSR